MNDELSKRREAAQNRVTRGNLPIDIHHLVSPNQLGANGAEMVE